MDEDKILRKRKPVIALFAGFFLFAFVLIAFLPRGFADDDGGIAGVNLLALHDSSSRQYDKHCLDCHADVLAQQSLDSSIPTVHVAMIPLVPGEENEERCAFCHRSVDLVQGVQESNGTLRKHVDADICRLCHGPDGPGAPFYQTGLSQTDPDGPALYELVCAACHGDLADSEVEGESAAKIREEIEENEGGMGPLRVLSANELQAIADALAQQQSGGD
jgi:cytochrome c5